MPSFPVVARTPFWSFCAGQRRIGPGQITDGTYKQTPSAGYLNFPQRFLPPFSTHIYLKWDDASYQKLARFHTGESPETPKTEA